MIHWQVGIGRGSVFVFAETADEAWNKVELDGERVTYVKAAPMTIKVR